MKKTIKERAKDFITIFSRGKKGGFVQTLAAEFGLGPIVKVVALADLTSLGDPTPLSTKSPR